MLNKQAAASRLFRSALQGTFRNDDPLGLHVQIMAAYDLLREYADAKKIALKWDIRDHIKEENFKAFIRDYFKKPYNFLKHASADADAEIDVTNIEEINDLCLLYVCFMHYDCFKEWSVSQKLFLTYVMLRHPDLLKEGEVKDKVIQAPDNLKKLDRPKLTAALHPLCEELLK